VLVVLIAVLSAPPNKTVSCAIRLRQKCAFEGGDANAWWVSFVWCRTAQVAGTARPENHTRGTPLRLMPAQKLAGGMQIAQVGYGGTDRGRTFGMCRDSASTGRATRIDH